jgi:hypothetical protein
MTGALKAKPSVAARNAARAASASIAASDGGSNSSEKPSTWGVPERLLVMRRIGGPDRVLSRKDVKS